MPRSTTGILLLVNLPQYMRALPSSLSRSAIQARGAAFDIVSTRSYECGVWMPVEWAAEDALKSITGNRIVSPNLPRREYWLKQNTLARTLGKFTPHLSEKMFVGLSDNLFLFMMALRKRFMPLLEDASHKKLIYLFDTWEPGWKELERSLNRAKGVQAVLMSSLQATAHFQGRFSFPVSWLPQAANSKEFNLTAGEWSKKKNIILNIGRTNKLLNVFFEKFAEKHGYEYIRPLVYGEVNFQSREELLKVLHQSKIVVVHPHNLDSPEITGCVSTLTARYFEAYQSSAVVCGFKPSSNEFDEVLTGMPFVSYEEPKSFETGLLDALEHPGKWIDAGLRCQSMHTWERRLRAAI